MAVGRHDSPHGVRSRRRGAPPPLIVERGVSFVAFDDARHGHYGSGYAASIFAPQARYLIDHVALTPHRQVSRPRPVEPGAC